MKAITIYQPWASLIIVGAKPYEFRKWSPRIRGASYAALIGERIVVHASAKPIDRSEVIDLVDRLNGSAQARASTALLREKAMPVLDAALAMTMRDADGSLSLPLSAGVGTAILGEPKSAEEIAEEFRLVKMNDSSRYDQANWGWPMLEVDPWPEAIPMRGFQGFWTWPTPEAAHLVPELAA